VRLRAVFNELAIARRCIRVAIAVQVQHARRRPAQPLCSSRHGAAHNEDPHRRVLFHAIGFGLQPVVEVTDLGLREIERRDGSKIHCALLAIAATRMTPGANDETLAVACGFGLSHATHRLVQFNAVVAVVEPADDVEIRHADLWATVEQPPRIEMRRAQPILYHIVLIFEDHLRQVVPG
jgi:hypothetical protein